MPPIQSERRKNIDKYLTMTVYNLQIASANLYKLKSLKQTADFWYVSEENSSIAIAHARSTGY